MTKVGSSKAIPIDVRIIAATNRNLLECIKEKTFREDLYYRLNVVPISLAPLRERKEDIDVLVHHFLDVFNQKYNKQVEIYSDALHLMTAYNWPGNIRELENVIEYLTICSSGNGAVDESLLRGILDMHQEEDHSSPFGHTLNESLENYEKSLIEEVLRNSRSLRDAGAKLGVNASTISRKIHQYGIDYPPAQK